MPDVAGAIGRASAAPLISLRGVGKRYGTKAGAYTALDGVDLDIAEGEFLCLLGASGCGKSTLLNMMAGFDVATSGSVRMRGRPIRSSGPDRMLFFQDAGAALFPWSSVADNVRFGLKQQGHSRAEQDARIEHYLGMVGLRDHADKYPGQLSGGMKQRLQIARALAIEPEVLLMDEPFAALDPITRRRMHDEVLRIWRETDKTIVFVTHDIHEAVALADRIVVLTVGPRSHVARTFAIDLPRPRRHTDPDVADLLERIEAAMNEAGTASEEGSRAA